jgi:hypothetical protein
MHDFLSSLTRDDLEKGISALQKCGSAASQIAQLAGAALSTKVDAQNNRVFSDTEVDHLLCALADGPSCSKLGTDPVQALKNRWICTTSSASPGLAGPGREPNKGRDLSTVE